MVKKTTKLRREIKEDIEELTGKDYKEVKDVFGFSITTVNYNWDSSKTLKWKKSNNSILKWLHDKGYSKKESLKFFKEIDTLSHKYDVVYGSGVFINYWNKDKDNKRKSTEKVS